MASAAQERTTTSVRIDNQVKDRLDDVKPFDSMSYSDVVGHLIDVYEDYPSSTSSA